MSSIEGYIPVNLIDLASVISPTSSFVILSWQRSRRSVRYKLQYFSLKNIQDLYLNTLYCFYLYESTIFTSHILFLS